MDAQQVRGDTRILALIGDPVAHSVSPLIHNHALRRLNLPFVYVPLCVPKDRIHVALQTLRLPSFAGANVTIPHKQAVLPYCDRVSEISLRLGAVNTLYYEGSLLCATTTDPHGFLKALSWMGHDPASGSVVILGAGATARTIAVTLAAHTPSPASLAILGRDCEKARQLADLVTRLSGRPAHCGSLSSPDPRILRSCSLLVNATPVGMYPDIDRSPLPPDVFHPDMAVFDTIYNPTRTLLLRYARTAGCPTQNGLRMLLYQALASFELWTGQIVSEELFDLSSLEHLVSGKGV